MACVNDCNSSIRILAIAAILDNNELFQNTVLASEFVPALIREVDRGWNDSDPWLLDNFSRIVAFLQDRTLMLDKHVESLHKFFDVSCGEG